MSSAAKPADHCSEFDCTDCRRHVVAFGPQLYGPMCAECIHIPGWHDVPELCEIFDPELAKERRVARENARRWYRRLGRWLAGSWPR